MPFYKCFLTHALSILHILYANKLLNQLMSCLRKVTNISSLSQVEEIKSYLEQRRSWLIICLKDGCLSSQSHFPSLLRVGYKRCWSTDHRWLSSQRKLSVWIRK